MSPLSSLVVVVIRQSNSSRLLHKSLGDPRIRRREEMTCDRVDITERERERGVLLSAGHSTCT